ncbi:MAG: MBL fold metallo-hydrolase [Rhodospirillaceae bacterium]|jgi:glyoxylase-like metal-dependent hydrolase (beta-lactamase superfamily II)
MKPQLFGDVRVEKIIDMIEPFDAARAYPNEDLSAAAQHKSWLAPHFYDFAAPAIILSFHSYVIRTPYHTILVDTCVGNHKTFNGMLQNWGKRDGPFLDNLAAAGVSPQEVDYVMCTHLHADHVGWNTQLKDGRWVPTFPRAKYVFSKNDLDASRERAKNTQTAYIAPSFQESVLPVIEAQQAEIIDTEFALDDALTILPTHGHTPGHYCVQINSGGRKGILTGDVLHNAVGIAHPEWSTAFCEDKVKSNATRTALVDSLTDQDVTLLPAHFAGPTAGRIVSQLGSDRRRFEIAPEAL